MKRIKIEVKRKHIKAGKYSLLENPIALALCDAGYKYEVDGLCVRPLNYWSKKKKNFFRTTIIMVLPLKAQKFIRRFDSGKPVKPFSFTLTIGD